VHAVIHSPQQAFSQQSSGAAASRSRSHSSATNSSSTLTLTRILRTHHTSAHQARASQAPGTNEHIHICKCKTYIYIYIHISLGSTREAREGAAVSGNNGRRSPSTTTSPSTKGIPQNQLPPRSLPSHSNRAISSGTYPATESSRNNLPNSWTTRVKGPLRSPVCPPLGMGSSRPRAQPH